MAVHGLSQRQALTPLANSSISFALAAAEVLQLPCAQLLPLDGLRVLKSCRRIQGRWQDICWPLLGQRSAAWKCPEVTR